MHRTVAVFTTFCCFNFGTSDQLNLIFKKGILFSLSSSEQNWEGGKYTPSQHPPPHECAPATRRGHPSPLMNPPGHILITRIPSSTPGSPLVWFVQWVWTDVRCSVSTSVASYTVLHCPKLSVFYGVILPSSPQTSGNY